MRCPIYGQQTEKKISFVAENFDIYETNMKGENTA